MSVISRPCLNFIIVATIFHIFIIWTYKNAGIPLKDWPREASRNISVYLSSKIPDLPPNLCNFPTKLLIIVHSKPDHIDARNAIRQTWGNKTNLKSFNSSLYFLLGKKKFGNKTLISIENSRYQDLIIEDFIDCYSNLTLKSVAMLKIFSHKDKCEALLKVDDDVYVNMEVLNRLVLTNITDKITGRVIRNERRQKNSYRRWYSPRYMYFGNYYPTFVAGPAYVMSQYVARKIYEIALQTPLFHLEDVFVTGICAKKANITIRSLTQFSDYGKPINYCNIFYLATLHNFPPLNLIELHNLYIRFELSCSNSITNAFSADIQILPPLIYNVTSKNVLK